MKYANAKELLPAELLARVQEYMGGGFLYVPKKTEARARWGQFSGGREAVLARNGEICRAYRAGASLDELTGRFCLSESSIRKIIRGA